MSDVVVSVIESNTAVTVSEQDVAVAVTESVTQVSASSVGLQGVQGASGVVSVNSPITNLGSSSSAIIGIDLTNIAETNAANAFTVGGNTITNDAVGTVPLSIIGIASQTANAFTIQSSTSALRHRFTDSGRYYASFSGTFGSTSDNSATLSVIPTTSGIIGQVIRGVAGQSADLLQIQNSGGTALARVDASGNLRSTGSLFSSTVETTSGLIALTEVNSGGNLRMTKQTATPNNPGANIARIYFRDGTNAGTLKLVVRAGTAGAETTILDNIPTT
jgi:hypothetical protein